MIIFIHIIDIRDDTTRPDPTLPDPTLTLFQRLYLRTTKRTKNIYQT